MATLTASGINCADGTYNGVYTGTALNNLDFPIGSHLGSFNNFSALNRAASTTMYTHTQNIIFTSGVGAVSALSGTWRSIASTTQSSSWGWYTLVVRVA